MTSQTDLFTLRLFRTPRCVLLSAGIGQTDYVPLQGNHQSRPISSVVLNFPQMKKDWVLTQEVLDGLFDWLNTDRQLAAVEYERIRRKLISIFLGRRCNVPEELADETINRVAVKVEKLTHYEGEKILYFYAVARNVYWEWLRNPGPADSDSSKFPIIITPNPHEEQQKVDCLERCLDELLDDNRRLFLEYHREEKRAKIEHRQKVAVEYGIAINALRIRAHRIRLQLKDCMTKCLEEMPAH